MRLAWVALSTKQVILIRIIKKRENAEEEAENTTMVAAQSAQQTAFKQACGHEEAAWPDCPGRGTRRS